MKVLVIVVTFNGARWIDKCFGSLTKSSIPVDVLAVDNASVDDSVLQIKKKFPGVKVIETGENLGFGKANNIGLKKAVSEKIDYVFLLNQDAWVETDTIEKLVTVAERNKSFGIISPFHLLPDTKALEWHFSIFISPEKCQNLVSDIYLQNTKEIYELEFVNAAAWLISKECINVVGGFDPLFPHYGEDDDYCNRVIFKKMKIGVTPVASITHDITIKCWDEIKFNPLRQLIFSFIELKNIRLSYHYLIFNFLKNGFGKLFSLLVFRKWKEFFFMTKVFLISIGYLPKIGKSRSISKKEFSYLN
jgi:GT2 family glycosyltransferase